LKTTAEAKYAQVISAWSVAEDTSLERGYKNKGKNMHRNISTGILLSKIIKWKV